MNATHLATPLLALTAACLASSAAAQTIPPGLAGLPDFGEVPYTAGMSVGPFGPIESPAADQDYRTYASEFWAFIDSGGTYTAPLDSWTWTAPELADIGGTSLTQVDPWGGGFDVFKAIHLAKLPPFTPGGPTIFDLVIEDPTVALFWRHYTVYRQVVTAASIDPVAHQIHINLLVEATSTGQLASVRGVPFFNGDVLVSDRLEILTPGLLDPYGSVPGASSIASLMPLSIGLSSSQQTSMQDCVDNAGGTLSPFSQKKENGGMYQPDEGYSGFGLVGGTPGFDCDDFADAAGELLTKGKAGASYNNVYCKFTSTDANGKKGKAAHLVTRVNSGGMYWLVDAQTGNTSGPHPDGTPMDVGPVVDPGYNVVPGSVSTDQTPHAPGDRSAWQGAWSGDPGPWYENPDMCECFATVTGMDPADFKPDPKK